MTATTSSEEWLLRRVLEGLRFPARRWQVLAHADLYGVDGVTRERLHRLPEGTYRDCEHVAYVLTAVEQDR